MTRPVARPLQASEPVVPSQAVPSEAEPTDDEDGMSEDHADSGKYGRVLDPITGLVPWYQHYGMKVRFCHTLLYAILA